jgi:hypothetical protein
MGSQRETLMEEMICRCSPEGREQADALMKEVRERLSREAFEVTDVNFLTTVVISLEHEYNAHISTIAYDMWGLVSADSWKEGGFKATFQCDDVEDGIAAVWKAFADHHAEEVRVVR